MISQQRVKTEADPLRLLRLPVPVDVVQVQTTATTIFTAQADTDFQIEALYAANTTGTDDYITLHLVPDGGSATAANQVAYQVPVLAKARTTFFNKDNMMMLQPLMSLVALCGVNDAVNVYGYGYDYQGQYSV